MMNKTDLNYQSGPIRIIPPASGTYKKNI